MLRSREGLGSSTKGDEKDQQIAYLKQAFCGFFKAQKIVEMEHLGRVICAILVLSVEEQGQVMDGISSLAPLLSASSTIETITSNFSFVFG